MNKICLGIIIVFLFIMGCTSEKKVIHGSLVPVDSLDVSENIEHCLKYVTASRLIDNNIYATDGSSFNVYSKDFKLLNSFGKKGKGPGEFMFATDFRCMDDTLYISDLVNGRVQKHDLKGNYLKSEKSMLPMKVLKTADKIVISNHTGRPDFGVYSIVNGIAQDTIIIKPKLDSLFSREFFLGVGSFNGDVIFYLADSQTLDVTFVKLNQDESLSILDIDKYLKERQHQFIFDVAEKDGKLYVLASSEMTDDMFQGGSTAGVTEYIFVFDSDYKLIADYKMPEGILGNMNTLIIDEDYMYAGCFSDPVIYKMKVQE